MKAIIERLIKRFAPICGIIGPGIIALGMVISDLAYSGYTGQRYNPINHFVSELGELGVSNLSGAFNWSLIIGGLVTAVFMIYMAAQIRFWIRWPLGLLGLLAALFAVLVGIYPMNYVGPHLFAALTFFNLNLAVALLYSLVFLFSKRHPFPKWLAIPGLVYVLVFALFTVFPSIFPVEVDFGAGIGGFRDNRPDVLVLAIFEWIMVLAILIWIALMGFYLTFYRGDGQNSQK